MVDSPGAEAAVMATPDHVGGWRSHGGGHRGRRSLPNMGSTLAWATLLARSGAKTGRPAGLLTIVAQFACGGNPVADMAKTMTQELTTESMDRAETVTWAP